MQALTAPSLLTLQLTIASLLMFATWLWSAKTLIGWRGAWGFAALSLSLGWLAEQMGTSHWARAHTMSPDVRPALDRASLGLMSRSIRVQFVRRIPVPMTQWLIGAQASHDIGVDLYVPWPTRLLFGAGRFVTACIDSIMRLVIPVFSLSRILCRVIGYHMLNQFMPDHTRPIGLPTHLLDPLRSTAAGWSEDTRAPRWLNALEDRLTTRGQWASEVGRGRLAAGSRDTLARELPCCPTPG